MGESGAEGNTMSVGAVAEIGDQRCIFAFNAFYAGREELGGTSSWELTWLASLKRVFGENVVVFNPDSYGPDDHRASDEALLRLVEDVSPHNFFMIYNPGHKWSREFITRSTLARIRERGVRTGAIWGDIQLPDQRRSVRALSGVVDVNICTASESAAARFGRGIPTLYTWVPVSDPAVLVGDRCRCGASVSYAGSLKGRRAEVIGTLREQGVLVHSGGGEAGSQLSRTAFCHLVAHDIGLSFSGHAVESLVNARTFEVVNQGTLLLEEWGRETAKWFLPFEEYVPWFSEKDLVDKARYFARNKSEAAEIAQRAHRKWAGLSDAALWSRALEVADDARRGSFHHRGFTQPLEVSLSRVGSRRRLASVVGERMSSTAISDPMFVAAYYATAARHGLPRRLRSSLRTVGTRR